MPHKITNYLRQNNDKTLKKKLLGDIVESLNLPKSSK